MHCKILLLLVTLYISSTASAKWADIPLEEVVQRADAGVIARLTHINKSAGWGVVHARGMLEVEEVLFGDVAVCDKIPIRWTVHAGIIPSGDISVFDAKHIWLVTVDDGIAAVWWQGILDPTRKYDVLTVMLNPLCARPLPGQTARLIYRNTTSETLSVPRIVIGNGVLKLPVGTEIVVSKTWEEETVKPAPGKVEFTNPPELMELAPGQSTGVDLRLADHYLIEPDTDYNLVWSVEGHGKSNPIPLYPTASYSMSHYYADEIPLWFKIKLLFMYSPTREMLIGVLLGGTYLAYNFHNRRRRSG